MAGCGVFEVEVLGSRFVVDGEVVSVNLTTFLLGLLVSGPLVFFLVSLDPESLGFLIIPCFIGFFAGESSFEVTWVSSDASVVRLMEPEASSLVY